jgi:TubC N-terminal docking domain
MTALELLTVLRGLHITLTPRGDRLRVDAPQGVLTDELRQAIRTQKGELLALVEEWSERAAIAEYCGGVPRAEAEQLAWQCVLGEAVTTEQTEGYAVPLEEVASSPDSAADVAIPPCALCGGMERWRDEHGCYRCISCVPPASVERLRLELAEADTIIAGLHAEQASRSQQIETLRAELERTHARVDAEERNTASWMRQYTDVLQKSLTLLLENHRLEAQMRLTREGPPGFETRTVRQLLALCHPDKWSQGQPATELAHELTMHLNALRQPRGEASP